MNESLSLRLDTLRIVGAMMVFAAHASYLGYTGSSAGFAHHYGHTGVIVFFVLSGYVIAFVSDTKHTDLPHYSVARFARLYSVLLPALILTPLLDLAGRAMDPEVYRSISDEQPVFRVIANATFMQQSNHLFVKYFSNGPMWSIGYEFWYYAIYGIFVYLRGTRRILFGVIAFVFAGYKVLLLMPVWLIGVAIYRLHARGVTMPQSLQRALIFFFAAMFLMMVEFGLFHQQMSELNYLVTSPLGGRGLGFSQWFVRDFFLGLVIGLLVLCMKGESPAGRWRSAPVARYIAGATFSIYLFHVPLILFLQATGIFPADSWIGGLALAATALACCFLLASLTERRLQPYKDFFRMLFQRLGWWRGS
ncbi:MAG: acyltransferase [Pseudomonadota bacterium]